MIAALMAVAMGTALPAPGVTVRDIVQTTDISSLAVSPDGRFVVFRIDHPSIEQNRVALTWYVAPVDGRVPPRAIADGGQGWFNSAGILVDESPIWSPDSRAIYFRALIGGSIQIWRASIDSDAAEQITADAADVHAFDLTAGGRAIIYRTGATRDAIAQAESHEHDVGVLVDASVDLALGVSGGGIINGRRASERLTGHWFERRGLLADETERVRIVLTSGRKEVGTLAPASADPALATVTVGSLSRTVPSTQDERGQACRAIRCGSEAVVRFQSIPDSVDMLVTTQTTAFEQSLYRWRKDSGSARLLVRSGGLVSADRDLSSQCGLTALFALCVTASATSPPRLVRVSLTTGAVRAILDPNQSLRSRIDTPARRLEWHDAAGHQFSGQLILPRGAAHGQPSPLVIDYYRCPGFLRGGVGDETPLLPLAGMGIAALCINAVFAPGTQDSRADYAVALSGIRAIVAKLGNERIIDTRRVGMAGLSFGSEVVMWVARHSSLLAAASIASGQLEPSYYWYNAVRGRDVPDALKTAWGLGDPDHDHAGWAAISPALDVDAIHTPLLMQLPELEARWSMELYAKLSRSATPVELYAFPDAAHVKSQPRQKAAAYERNLDWFSFWLAGREDRDPAKLDQYARWRTLAARQNLIAKIDDRARP